MHTSIRLYSVAPLIFFFFFWPSKGLEIRVFFRPSTRVLLFLVNFFLRSLYGAQNEKYLTHFRSVHVFVVKVKVRYASI